MAKEFKECLFTTTDNWFGNFDNNKCMGSLHEIKEKVGTKNKRRWIVTFEGNDDFGMSKRFDDYREARDLFDKLRKFNITKKYLQIIGFEIW